MLMDLQTLCSDAQSIVGTAASAIVSTNTIDLGVTGTVPGGLVGALVDDPGRAFWFKVFATITTTVLAAGGASNVTAKVLQSVNADLSSADVLGQSPAIPKATLVAGYQFALPSEVEVTKRYFGFSFTPDTNDTTAGNVTAGVVPHGGTGNRNKA